MKFVNPLAWLWSWCLAIYGAFLFIERGMVIRWYYSTQFRKGAQSLAKLEKGHEGRGFRQTLTKQAFINFARDPRVIPQVGKLTPGDSAPTAILYTLDGKPINLQQIFQQFDFNTFVLNFGSYS